MASAQRAAGLPTWALGAVPLAAVVALVLAILVLDPIAGVREVPPVEAVAVERTVLEPGRVTLKVRNDGRDPVTIAQILVNESYVSNFDVSDPTLERLGSATIEIDYRWEEGMPLTIGLLTSTGVVVEHEIEAATATPQPDLGTFGVYALLGIYIGVIPVAIGLLFFPALRRISRRWLNFFLAFTVGLLVFLLIDTIEEGLELAGATAATLNGVALFMMGGLVAIAVLVAFQQRLQGGASKPYVHGLALAYLIAAGIGLHNLGEGLAVGAAVAAGEVALGRFLVLGFAIHNTTEGLAIVAPLGARGQRPSVWHFVGLGAVAGAPTIAGAWGGGFAFSPAWASLAFGVAAGAIAQVVWQIGRSMDNGRALAGGLGALGFLIGLAFMYATGLFTA